MLKFLWNSACLLFRLLSIKRTACRHQAESRSVLVFQSSFSPTSCSRRILDFPVDGYSFFSKAVVEPDDESLPKLVAVVNYETDVISSFFFMRFTYLYICKQKRIIGPLMFVRPSVRKFVFVNRWSVFSQIWRETFPWAKHPEVYSFIPKKHPPRRVPSAHFYFSFPSKWTVFLSSRLHWASPFGVFQHANDTAWCCLWEKWWMSWVRVFSMGAMWHNL